MSNYSPPALRGKLTTSGPRPDIACRPYTNRRGGRPCVSPASGGCCYSPRPFKSHAPARVTGIHPTFGVRHPLVGKLSMRNMAAGSTPGVGA